MDVLNEENNKTLLKPLSLYIIYIYFFCLNSVLCDYCDIVLILYFFTNHLNIVLEVKLRNGKKVIKYKGEWNNLPDLLLENIFSYLNAGEKYNASTTCQSWYSSFYLPYSWHTFVFDDTTLTRRKFNYYSGWQVSVLVLVIRIHRACTINDNTQCIRQYRYLKSKYKV